MIIEFADPGYNWGFLWWPLGVLVLAIGIASYLYSVDFDEMAGTVLALSIIALIIAPTLIGITEYGARVSNVTTEELSKLGFSNVDVSGDRFTAATEDGQYFRGVLVDLEPESGYAYQVLELTGTEK